MHLILASNSPRRRELLAEAGYRFEVLPSAEDVECGVCSESGPAGLVAELAFRKAAAVVRQVQGADESRGRGGHPAHSFAGCRVAGSPNTIVLAADTVAECDGFILGKPRDEVEARAMLTRLSGREHRVLTGVCLIPLRVQRGGQAHFAPKTAQNEPVPTTQPLIRVAVTKLRMDPLTTSQLNEYLASGAWEGKAGAFGYQDRLGWVHIVEGSESNVVGLPMEMLAEMLDELKAGSREHGAESTERR
ncbi:MAG: Maf family protein [Planctomycetes bacterium]|nr:Maf family protein [Planctomycetota bacterium]